MPRAAASSPEGADRGTDGSGEDHIGGQKAARGGGRGQTFGIRGASAPREGTGSHERLGIANMGEIIML